MFVGIVVELNAFDPRSLLPTTLLPLIVNTVVSEFWADKLEIVKFWVVVVPFTRALPNTANTSDPFVCPWFPNLAILLNEFAVPNDCLT